MTFVAGGGIRHHNVFDGAPAVDSRCAVRDLTTAPRLGAFGLTR